MMNSYNKLLCNILFVFIISLLFNDQVEANKKLQRIILASIIGKTLKSHMNHQPSIVPIVMPPFKSSMEKHVDNGQNGYNNNGHNIQNGQSGLVQGNHVGTITVHHYHHHTNHIEPIYSKYDDDFDGSYNHIVEPITQQNYHSHDSHDHSGGFGGYQNGFHRQIGHNAGSLLSGSLGGNVGNILSGSIGGQIG